MSARLPRQLGLGLILLLVWLLAAREIANLNLAFDAADADAGARAHELRPDSARATLVLSGNLYRAGRYGEAAAAARAAIRNSPIHPAGLRLLGQSRNRQRIGSGNDLILLAGRLGWRDQPTQVWLLQQAALVGELDVAGQRAEALILLNRDPSRLFPLLRALSLTPSGREVVVQSLIQRPPYRGHFFELAVNASAPELNAMVGLIEALRGSAAPVTIAEGRTIVDALFMARRYEEAAALYRLLTGRNLDSLPIHDGGFDLRNYERGSGLTLFDWLLMNPAGSSASVEAPAAEGGNQVLVALTDGDSGHAVVTRAFRLRPGRYLLSYRMRSEDEGARQALQFAMSCAIEPAGSSLLAPDEAPLPLETWSARSQLIVVPDDCPAQQLILAPRPSTGGTDHEAWFDDVAIRPA